MSITDQGRNLGITRSKSFTGILSHKRSASLVSNGSSIISNGHRSETLPRTLFTPVLGECHRGSAGSLRSLGMVLAKVPKTPRPTRTAAIFEVVSRGLRECINVTEEDINSLKGNVEVLSVNSQQSQGKLYELEKQLKAAERYLKRLEYQLTALEELQDRYALQQKLRDGVRTMARAFVQSPGRERDVALNNVRSGYKECTETLCIVEASLERMMGTLQLEMKGVQGFARLCTGDSFEITMRHGHQKWKTRGRVLKNNQQSWDSKTVLFKALLGEVLHIKAVEMKSITKAVILGNKYCDTKDLFCANPQIMTVNLNSSGSLKLNLIVTWNPLHGSSEESLRHHLIGGKSSGSPACKKRTLPSHSHSHGSISSQTSFSEQSHNGKIRYSPDVDSGSVSSSQSSASAHSSTRSTPDVDFHRTSLDCPRFHETDPMSGPNTFVIQPTSNAGRFPHKSTSLDSMHLYLNVNTGPLPRGHEGPHSHPRPRQPHAPLQPALHHYSLHSTDYYSAAHQHHYHPGGRALSPPPLLHKADSSECCSMDLGSSQGSHLGGPTLPEVVHVLSSCLEDIRGQYPELHNLELVIIELERIVRGNNSRRGSHTSDISLSVESALECFDFLNTEVDEDDVDNYNSIKEEDGVDEEGKTLDHDLTAKTSDSGIASIARQLRGLNSSSPEFGTSPRPPTTGNEQLDLALCTHLMQCQRLLENIGTFGPLRHRERISLEKLKTQTAIIERLVKLVNRSKASDKNISITGHEELKDDPQLQQLWDYCTDRGASLCISADHLFQRLASRYQMLLKQQQQPPPNSISNLPEKVARLCTMRVLDASDFDPDAIVTVHLFSDYFWRNCSQRDSHGNDVDDKLHLLAEEVILMEALQSTNTSLVCQTIRSQSGAIPPKECLHMIIGMLCSDNRQLQDAVSTYLAEVNEYNALRNIILDTIIEGLESKSVTTRQGACIALACVKAFEYIEQLAYVCQTDESLSVKSAAKAALLSFGSKGRKVYDQTQLSSLGFQGLALH